jgi:hypothetical protein
MGSSAVDEFFQTLMPSTPSRYECDRFGVFSSVRG